MNKFKLLQVMNAESEVASATTPVTKPEESTDNVESTESTTGDTSTENEGETVFTQDQVNKLISKRVREVKNQYKDYAELKTQVETLQEKLKTMTDENKALEAKYKETTFTSALEKASKDLNLDTDLAMKILDKDKIIFKDESPTNLKDLLQVVIEKHPNLVKKPVTTPDVPATVTSDKPQFSLHKTSKTNFFQGSGVRINLPKQSSENT